MSQVQSFLLYTLVSCALAGLGAQAANPTPPLKVLALGQLDNSLLKQMAPVPCGPYFTFTPTDTRGGGFVAFAVDDSSPDQPSVASEGIKVVSMLVGGLRAEWCEKCASPELRVDASSQFSLAISKEQFNLAPCLKRAKFSRR